MDQSVVHFIIMSIIDAGSHYGLHFSRIAIICPGNDSWRYPLKLKPDWMKVLPKPQTYTVESAIAEGVSYRWRRRIEKTATESDREDHMQGLGAQIARKEPVNLLSNYLLGWVAAVIAFFMHCVVYELASLTIAT